MTLSSQERKSGVPSPAPGVLSLNRKSKLQTPQSRSVSGLSDLSTSKNRDSIRSISSSKSVATSNDAFESSCFLTEKKKSIDVNDTTDGQIFATGRKSSATALASSSSTATDGEKCESKRKLSSSSSTSTSALDNEEAVRVGVRIRPLLEKDNGPRAFVLGPTENTIIKNADTSDNNIYPFNHVYGETSSTQQLYDDMVSDIVESVGQGRNGTIFTYGQTSTGKTYTMHGILMAAGKDLFRMTKDNADCNDHGPIASTSLTSVRISCMELYNEELRDLLCNSTGSLSIQEDRRGNVQIPNLTERMAANIDELMEVIQIAEENRTVASTAMNEQSSRSHTIFRITYVKKEAAKASASFDELTMGEESEDKENDSICCSKASQRSSQKVITTVSTLNLVDLAGSESVRVTGAKGERQKEGGVINQSLLTLSTILRKLGKTDQGHINYRDSKLTRILKPSLSGNARMGCICCISPAVQFSEESKSTLDFASRTMLVTTNAKSNQTVEYDDALVEEFERGIEHAKMETAKAEESRLQMEQSLQDAEDQIVYLRASVEVEKSKVSSLESGESDYMIQVAELKSDHDKNADKLLKKISAYLQMLEASMAQCESENNNLREQQEQDHAAFGRERKRMEEERASMKENHTIELAKKGKESKRTGNQDSDSNLLERVAELERMNLILTRQADKAYAENQSSQDENDTLKCDMAALSKEKLQVELKLAREMLKIQKRKDEAKERRQKFQGRLSGMPDSLKDDLVNTLLMEDECW